MLESLEAAGQQVREIRATGGFARSAFWRQLLADILNCPIVRTQADEGPAYGAALLAGVASGVFADVSEACALITLRPDVNEPDASNVRRYADYYGVYRALYPATRSTMHLLSLLANR